MTNDIQFLQQSDGSQLAYKQISARKGQGPSPSIVFLPGFRSDMEGSKALALSQYASTQSVGFTRFDYSGHGASSGAFRDGTISRWRADTLAILDQVTAGPQVLVGSSMGGWLALLAALARPARVAGLVLIAPAPDFTDKLMWPELAPDAQAAILRDGFYLKPSAYDPEPTIITRDLIEDGAKWSLLEAPIPISCPVRIIQGMADPDVPWRHALHLSDQLAGADVRIQLIKDGDHRLSRESDIAVLTACLSDLLLAYR
jgi:pimeloyl-ACP methyl ester carboxylesterase